MSYAHNTISLILGTLHELMSLMLHGCCNLDMPAANHANTDIYQAYWLELLASSMVLYMLYVY